MSKVPSLRRPARNGARHGFFLYFAALGVLAACGRSTTNDDDSLDGSSGAAGSLAGAGAIAGSAGAGNGSAGASASAGAAGASSAGASGGGAGLGGSDDVDCDPRKIVCKRVAPECPGEQVPSVEGSCYGACVDIDRCVCTEAEACPDRDRFVCHMNRMRCGPYLR